MPQDASCPKCKAAFPVTEARNAFTVACPKCDTEMTVEFKKPAVPPEAGQPPYEMLVKPGALATLSTAPPPPKKKKEDEDDETKRKGGSPAIVLLSGGFGLLFVLGGLGLTAWFLFFFVDTTTTVAANNNPKNNQPGKPNNPPNNQPGKPGPGPGPEPGPVTPPKPKDWFELKPVSGTLPLITAPRLPSDVSNLDLSEYAGVGAKVGSVAVGGGGKYIVMHFPGRGQLCVFDVTTAQVTTVAADSGDIHLTAGLSKVVTCGSGYFRVYNLPNLAKQYDTNAPGGIHGMAMGSRTNGPLLTVAVFGEVKLWDIGDSAIKEVEASGKKPQPEIHWHEKGLRASPDGTVFSTHDGFRADQKTTLLTVQNRQWKVTQDIAAVPFPSVDGHFFGNGIVVNKAAQDMKYGGIGAGSGTWFLPSVSNKDYFLKIAPVTLGTGARTKRTLSVSVHKGKNSDVPLAGTTALTDAPEFEGMSNPFNTEPSVVFDQHFFLIPEAKLLVILNGKKDRLVLRQLNIK